MATPTFVKYSRVSGTIEDALARLEERVMTRNQIHYYQFAALRPDTSSYSAGLEVAQDLVRCDSRPQILQLAANWECWGVSYLARTVPGHVNFCFFDREVDSFGVTCSFDASLISYEPAGLREGEWLRRLLIGIVSALGCEVCGFGRDNAYNVRYESLDPNVVVQRLRSGDLFVMDYPNLNAVSIKLAGVQEVASLLQNCPKRSEFFDYRLTTTGYHIFSEIP